jgi:1-acyl-sn-glycerol-3-phosphate acyltransferase
VADINRSTWERRLVTIPAVAGAWCVLTLGAPVWMPIAVVADAVRRRPLPILRLGAYGIVYLSAEIFAIVSASVLWVASGCGLAVKSAWSQRLHSAAQARWVAWLVAAAGRVLGLRISIAGADLMPPGPVIVLCRHTSLIDTLIPATLAAERGMRVRYVLKSDLLWDPALDLFGHRLPNHFVDRSGSNTAAELRALDALAAGAGTSDAVVIFPEGTRWSPTRQERLVERLRQSDPEAADAASTRRATMPPRTAGTAALLGGNPTADVVILMHSGLEGFTGLSDALRSLPLARPVDVELRRVPRSEVPTDREQLSEWLHREWRQVDEWVANRLDRVGP